MDMRSACRLRLIFIVCLLVSAVSAHASARLYALWQPAVGGTFVPANDSKAVGGNLVLRLVVESVKASSTACVDKAAITEDACAVHKAIASQLPVKFYSDDPNPEWGDDPKAIVLQSRQLSTSRYHNWRHTVSLAISVKDGKTGKVVRRESASARITFKNLTVQDIDYAERVWGIDPGSRRLGLPVHFKVDHAQSGKCNITYEIFSVKDSSKPVSVHEVKDAEFPKKHEWYWDGKLQNGEPADAGLFTFRVSVENCSDGTDKDTDRSTYLTIGPPNVEPKGDWKYVDPGTPTFSDDDYYECLAGYSLRDSQDRPAKALRLTFYNPDYAMGQSWDYRELKCRSHGLKPDGNMTSTSELTHVVIAHIPTLLIDSDGISSVVVGCLDGHADHYKDHLAKPAIDRY